MHLVGLRTIAMLVAIALILLPSAAPGRTALALAPAGGEDVCPEPNDEFQAACFLGTGSDALGFINRPDDADAYRFESLDFGARAKVTVHNPPRPYQVVIANWEGRVFASSVTQSSGAEYLEAPLLPGSYYLFVHSRGGAFSANEPYRLHLDIEYANGQPPTALYRGDYRAGADDETDVRPEVDFLQAGGRRTISLKNPGTSSAPDTAEWTLTSLPAEFTATVDVRVTGGSEAGFHLIVGGSDDKEDHLMLTVNVRKGRVTLHQWVDDVRNEVLPWQVLPAALTGGKDVHRVVLTVRGGVVDLNLNGRQVVNVPGLSVPAGDFVIGAITWSEPIEVSFDNVLITTPARVRTR